MNMKLIDPSDPLYFYQTSDKPYDRHNYRLEFNEGNNSIEFGDYEQLRAYWFECARNWKDCKVIVLDKKQNKKKSNGGFKQKW